MKDLSQSFFTHDEDDDDLMPLDEMDQLFLQLEMIQPPSSLVKTILDSVARLPRHEFLSDREKTGALEPENDGPIVHNRHLQPS